MKSFEFVLIMQRDKLVRNIYQGHTFALLKNDYLANLSNSLQITQVLMDLSSFDIFAIFCGSVNIPYEIQCYIEFALQYS